MCSINGSLSNNHSLTCGVPQRTILGPLPFLLYINDLPNCLSNCEPRMYADDTHLTYAGDCVDSLQLCLNLDLENVHNWLRANKLYAHRFKKEIKYSHRFPRQSQLMIIKLVRSPPQNHSE